MFVHRYKQIQFEMFLRVGNTNGVYCSEDNCFRIVVYLFQRQALSIYYVINNTNQIMSYTTFVMEDNWRQRKIFLLLHKRA